MSLRRCSKLYDTDVACALPEAASGRHVALDRTVSCAYVLTPLTPGQSFRDRFCRKISRVLACVPYYRDYYAGAHMPPFWTRCEPAGAAGHLPGTHWQRVHHDVRGTRWTLQITVSSSVESRWPPGFAFLMRMRGT